MCNVLKSKERVAWPIPGEILDPMIATWPSVSPTFSVIGSMPFPIASLINLASFLMRLNRFSSADRVQSPPNRFEISSNNQQADLQLQGKWNGEMCKWQRNTPKPLPWFLDCLASESLSSTSNGSIPASTAALRVLACLLIKVIRSQTDLYLAPPP